MSQNNYITKNDMMFFQNEVFYDLKNMDTSINSKISKLKENIENIEKEYNPKFNEFSNKVKDLLGLLSVTNIDHEKVEELYRIKDKLKDEITENKTRFLQYKKMIDSSLYKYDRAIIDNLEVPGLIGYNCKFNNLRTFLDFANGEINSFQIFKNQQINEMKKIKDKIDKFSQKLEISNKDIIQRVDLIFTSKVESFKNEIEKKFETNNVLNNAISLNTYDYSQLEMEIKINNKLSNQIKEELKKEIDNIIIKMKQNREVNDANYIIINRQKEDIIFLKEQFEKLSLDIENLKKQKIDEEKEKENNHKKVNYDNLNKHKKSNNEGKNKIIKNFRNNKIKKISSASDLLKDNNEDKTSSKKNIKNKNEDIKYISKEKRRQSLFIKSNNPLINENKPNENNIKSNFRKKKNKSLNIENRKNFEFFINDIKEEDENIFKRKINKKLLTYNQKINLKLGSRNLLNKNFPLSYTSSSSSSSSAIETDKKVMKIQKGKTNSESINKTVSKLIKLKPIEHPIKLNLKYFNEKTNINNKENSKNDLNNIINNNFQNKTKPSNNILNTFNKSKAQNNKSLKENNKEINSGHRKLNLTDKEILKNIFNNIINKEKEINSISKAVNIKNYKNIFNLQNKNNIKQKIYSPLNDTENTGTFGTSGFNYYSHDENNYSNNESNNNCITSPYNQTKNISSLYRTGNNDLNFVNGFLTSIPIKSQTINEENNEEIIMINQKIKKINNKLNKINYNTKIIINRLNLLEEKYKPFDSKINDILIIILLIYEFIKKRNTNNKLSKDLFNNSNIKNCSKLRKLKGQGFISINKSKNFLYTTNGFNFEEGGLYSSEQTKEELEKILKKIEPFLIKQFKDTI